MNKEKFLERGFLLVALSSISILALIAFFIFEQGLPLIWKVGLPSFLLGDRWFPSKGSFGIFPMIVGSFWVTLGALVVGVPVGFVQAEESKAALQQVSRPSISVLGRKGGSSVAVAIIHALLELAKAEQ